MMQDQLTTTFDHLIFGCYSLDEAADFIYEQLGVQPESGGHHVTMGTYNQLLKLDDTTYFEIIAIDRDTSSGIKVNMIPIAPKTMALTDINNFVFIFQSLISISSFILLRMRLSLV